MNANSDAAEAVTSHIKRCSRESAFPASISFPLRNSLKMSRTLDHVISECLDDKLRSKSVRDQILRDYDYYKSCWDSLNKWIESKLRKNKVQQ